MKLPFAVMKSRVFIRFATYFAFAFLVAYTAYLHGTNMTLFPYYESDEGTYVSQAWSVLEEGTLSPYTYWYDHPPVGWFVLAGWFSALPDTYFTFGNSIDTARVLMCILFVINVCLVFWLARRLTGLFWVPYMSALIYASSPLVVYFSRRVLLDNIQITLLMISMLFLLGSHMTLRRYAASGMFFALAFLTKITAMMFLIPVAYYLWFSKDETHKLFRIGAWYSAAGVTTSLYFVYALIKSEFFPPLTPDSPQHVSFIETLSFQMSRGGSVPFYQQGSDFMAAMGEWLGKDPLLVYLTAITLLAGVVLSIVRRDVHTIFITLMSLFFVLFLIRGGLVINFYFLPLMPFLFILLALVVKGFGELIEKRIDTKSGIYSSKLKIMLNSVVFLGILACLWHYNVNVDQRYLYVDETTNQNKATEWVKTHVPEQADIIIDVVMYVELHDPRYINDKVFTNAEWFYKVSRDPLVRDTKYNNNWKNFDYLVLTHEMLKQLNSFGEEDIARQALDNSLPIVKWFENSTSYIDEQKRLTTNGDWSMVYDVNSQTRVQLADAWEKYKEDFIHSYGQVVDPDGDVTTSEGQSYAMLRAVWMNDHETFKGVWAWTQHHLQHRVEDKLISWKWDDGVLADPANATDADVDIALALLFASRTFGEEQYLEDAREILDDLWRQSVVDVEGTYYLVSSNASHGQVPEGLLFNPSYMSPAHFRIFASVDPDHDWEKLANDTYEILDSLTESYRTPLVKNWYVIDPATGYYYDAFPYVGLSANHSSYDSFRINWRLWLDYVWFNNDEAESYLRRTGRYLSRFSESEAIPTIIDPVSGDVLSTQPSVAISSSYVLPLALIEDAEVSRDYYKRTLEDIYDESGYWGYETVYFDQNWAWFIAAFYNNDLYNIWDSSITFTDEPDEGIRF